MASDQSNGDVLRNGEFQTCELTPLGSNYTFVASLQLGDQTGQAIYKPRDGEVPLWDFPRGTLYKREYGAYLLSEVLGWNFIPRTIIREGPYGIGSVQQYVDHDPRMNYYTLSDGDAEDLRMICCFDLVANNTDRKANHVLVDEKGKLWGIDQGLTFHSDTKIRTVIWDFGGEPIPEAYLSSLSTLLGQFINPGGTFKELLDLLLPEEVTALQKRIQWVLSERAFPGIPGRRRRH
ncbi:MAG: SCO1664 family protein [Chloroflexota bacterium]|nr:SCO1664 family protein [Chloroflexota bacterium]